eukprot:TRINITY_DN8901_c0_g1_i1.p1 TRINITY_DN8901_c0_g1~~TRINITY_DN8901_c0_g1_i1.p1  ORF type:complete len:1287 (+),score=377.84 TRINITY_DN8901_c0_g1_i1:56-3916(+)
MRRAAMVFCLLPLAAVAFAAPGDDELSVLNGFLKGVYSWPSFSFSTGQTLTDISINNTHLSAITVMDKVVSESESKLLISLTADLDVLATLDKTPLAFTVADVALGNVVVDLRAAKGTTLAVADAATATVTYESFTYGEIACTPESKKTCNKTVDALLTDVHNNPGGYYTNELSKIVTDVLVAMATHRAALTPVVDPWSDAAGYEAKVGKYADPANPESKDMEVFSSKDSAFMSGAKFLMEDFYGGVVDTQTKNTALGQLIADKLKGKPLPLPPPGDCVVWQQDNSILTMANMSFTNLVVTHVGFEAVGNFTLMLSVKVRGADIEGPGNLIVRSHEAAGYEHSVTGGVALKDVDVDMNITITAIANATRYGETWLGALLADAPLFGCFLGWPVVQTDTFGTNQNVNLDLVYLRVRKVGGLDTSRLLPTKDWAVLPALFRALYEYAPNYAAASQSAYANSVTIFSFGSLNFDIGASDLMHGKIPVALALDNLFLAGVSTECPFPENPVVTHPLNYTSSKISLIADFVVNQVLGHSDVYGLPALLHRAYDEYTPKIDWNSTWDFTDYVGTVAFGVKDLRVHKFPSMPTMELIHGVDDHVLSHSLTVTDADMSIDLQIAIEGEGAHLSDNVTVGISVGELDLSVLTGLWLNETAFEFTRFNEFSLCTVLPQNFTLSNLEVVMKNLALDVTCEKDACTSPRMSELGVTLKSKGGRAMLQTQINDFFASLKNDGTSALEHSINTWLQNTRATCNNETAPTDTKTWSKGDAYGLVFGIVGACAVVLVVYFCWAMRVGAPPSKGPRYSLLNHPALPAWQRYGLVLWLVGTVALFLAANIDHGAVVHAVLHVAGSKITLRNLFTYSLANTISDFFNGGVYALGLLVLGFSGIWPYLKIWLMIFAWVSTPAVLSPARRAHLLESLDFFGKWSLIDAFLMIVMLVSFRMTIALPNSLAYLPNDFVAVDVVVSPCFGLYGFTVAAVMSLTVNHLMVLAQRACDLYDETNGAKCDWFEDPSPERRVLAFHVAEERRTPETQRKQRFRAWAMIGLMVITLVLLIVGTLVDVFKFEIEGLAAWAIDLTDSHVSKYSLITLDQNVYNQMDYDGMRFGYGFLAAVFMIFVLAMPILQFVFLLVLWLAPLTLREQKIFFFINEITAAWCALEVCIVIFIVSLLEISTLAEYMVGHHCDALTPVLKDLPFLAGYAPKCFGVKSEFSDGCWILFASGVLSNVAYYVAWRQAERLINDRHEEALSSPVYSQKDGDPRHTRPGFDDNEKAGLLAANTADADADAEEY